MTPVDRFRNLLAFCLIAAFVLTIPALLLREIPPSNKDIITYVLGQLSGMATLALGYYFVNKAGQDALDQKRADNTGKLVDAVAAANSAGGSAAAGATAVADAAADKAGQIAGTAPTGGENSNG